LQCIGIQPFSNSSELLTTSCSRNNFKIISQTVHELSRRQTDTHAHRQTLLKTSAFAAQRTWPRAVFVSHSFARWQLNTLFTVICEFSPKFSGMIAKPSPIYSESFSTIALTVSPKYCKQTNKRTNKQTMKHTSPKTIF